jgi:hypothetical protein
MGKKSRKKQAPASSKRERKKELEERRERNIAQIDAEQDEVEDEEEEEEEEEAPVIGLYSRVWFKLCESGQWRRGVVKQISQDHPSGGEFTILPVIPEEDDKRAPGVIQQGSDFLLQVHANGMVVVDTLPWTLRFAVGDEVICSINGHTDWGIVTKLFCRSEKNLRFYCYECRVGIAEYHYVNDENDCIRRIDTGALRFAPGDKVLFRTNEEWNQGEVLQTHYNDSSLTYGSGYAPYVCRGVDDRRGKSRNFFVERDTDQYITKNVEASPRQQLFDSIEKNCSSAHIDFVVKSSGIDVGSIQNIVLAKSIEAGNYEAMMWLHDTFGMNLQTFIMHDTELPLLHQCAVSPYATRFFEAAFEDPRNEMHLWGLVSNIEEKEPFLLKVDNEGRSWLHRLVETGNTRALDCVLSRNGKLCSALAYSIKFHTKGQPPKPIYNFFQDKAGTNIRDLAQSSGNMEMVRIIEEFASWFLLCELSWKFEGVAIHLADIKAAMEKFDGEPEKSVFGRLLRFVNRYPYPLEMISIFEYLISEHIVPLGDEPFLSWLVHVYPPFLLLDPQMIVTTSDANDWV